MLKSSLLKVNAEMIDEQKCALKYWRDTTNIQRSSVDAKLNLQIEKYGNLRCIRFSFILNQFFKSLIKANILRTEIQ